MSIHPDPVEANDSASAERKGWAGIVGRHQRLGDLQFFNKTGVKKGRMESHSKQYIISI